MNIFQEYLILSIYLLLAEFESTISETNTNQQKRQSPCAEHIKFSNCKNGQKRTFRNQVVKITSIFKSCQKTYIFDYNLVEVDTGEVKEFHDNTLGATLIVEEFTLKNGNYRVVVNVHTANEDVSLIKDDCILTVEVSPPVALIKGGFQRYIGAGQDLVFDASESIDYNSELPTEPKNFVYSWVYDCDDCGGFQTATEKGPKFVLSGAKHKKEIKYLIKLGVKTKWWNETVYAQQLVYPRKSTPGVEILCDVNCNPPFRNGEMTLEGHCIYQCPEEIKWTWNVYKVPKNDEDVISGSADWELELTKPNMKEHSLKLEEESFKSDTGYLVTLSINDFNETASSYKFVTHQRSEFRCSVRPKFGFVLETKFRFRCTGQPFGTYFWASVSTDKDNEQVLEYDSSWEYLEFIVPAMGTVSLHYTDYSGMEGIIDWNPNSDDFKLSELEKDAEAIKKLYEEGDDSAVSLIESGDFGKAMDRMNMVSKSISKLAPSDYGKVEAIAKKLIEDLKKLPMKDSMRLEQAISIMADLTNINVPFDTEHAKDVTEYCAKLAHKYRKMVKHNFLGGKTSDMPVHTTVIQLMDCTAAGNRPNLAAIEEKEVDINVTTVSYIIEEGNLNTETYDEYKDESKVIDNKASYIDNTRSFVDVCTMNGRSMLRRAKSLSSSKELFDVVEAKGSSVLVVQKPGYEIVQTPYKLHGVKVTFSKDLVDSELIYALIMCVTDQNLFWWQDVVDIVSSILIISLKIGESLLTRYKKPFEIVFKLSRFPKIRFPSLHSSVKMRQLMRDPEHSGEEPLAVYLIYLEAGYSLVVYFQNVDPELKLNVISTTFKLPILDDFKENMQIVNEQGYFFVDENVYDYDTVRLLAVIPSPPNEKREHEVFKFKMDAYAVTCMKWKSEGYWTPGCRAGFRGKLLITCYCQSLSTITSTVKNIPIKEWQNYIPLPVDLEEENFLGICLVVIVMFLLYCVAICFSVYEEDHTLKAIYFLSDVVRENRYGYLIIVQTSFRLDSGTTSNVVIKLRGIRGESEPHVLNYPDPLMHMMQRRNQDWFLLATKNNLGRLIEIELWIDGVGSSPTWQCSNVAIFDLQHRRWYNFRISRNFTIYPKPHVYMKSHPIDEKKDRTSMRVIINIFKKCLPSFRLFNLSLRRTEETLSFIKRLTMMLSILTSIAVWCIIINGAPKMNASDNIMKTCTFTFSPSLISHGVGGSITTAVYHIPIKYFFLTSQVQIPYHSASQKSKKPMIFTLICWLIISALISINLTLITVYGVWIPDVTAMELTTEIIIGMVFYVFFVDVVYSTIDKMINGTMEMENYVKRLYHEIFDDIERQRLVLYRVFGKYLLRPFLKHLYTPVHGLALRVLWHTEKTKYEVRELVESLSMFLIYIGLMYMVILANKDYRNVYSNQQVKNIIAGSASRTFPFDKVISINSFDKYLEETLIEATQTHTWYGTYAVKDPGMTVDYNNKIIGVIRLRQHRAKFNSCEIPESMNFVALTCISDYFHSQTKRAYGEKWNATKLPPTEGRMRDVWRYSTSKETGTSKHIGKLGTYDGGGYVAYLGRGMKNSLINLKYLREHDWIDRQTRSIFIEFLLYDANFNIFNAVQYVIEKSALGYLKKEVKVETSKMLLKENDSIVALPILLGLFLVLVVVFSLKTIIRIKMTHIWYFRDLWHLVDIVLIILSMTCVSMFYRRSSEVGNLLKSLEGKDHKEFVNYFSLLKVDNTFTIVCAILITVATLKLWGLFRFIVIFRVVERTFRTSFFPLCALFLYNGIVILAFSCLGFLLFVDHSYRFEGYFNTVEFLLQLNMRPFEGEERDVLVEPKLGLGYVFYVGYAITVNFFNCIYTALIIIYYAKAQDYYSNHQEIYSVWDHLKDQLQFYYNVWRIKLRRFRLGGGAEEAKHSIPVSPKSDETRYADSLKLSVDKIKAMSLVSLCAIRNSNPNRKPLTQKDIRIMTYALYYLKKLKHKSEHEDEDIERFYKGKMGQNKVKLIHETVLKKVEAATSILLGRTLQETLKDMNINRDQILMEENTRQLTRMKENLSIMLETVKRINIRVLPRKERID